MTNLRGACYARDLVVDVARKYVAALLLAESEGHPVTIRAFGDEKAPAFAGARSEQIGSGNSRLSIALGV
jgi:hypothetical protein